MPDDPKIENMNDHVGELYYRFARGPEYDEETLSYVWRPYGELPPEAQIMYDRGDAGRCMTCGNPLGEQAAAVVNHIGLIMTFCDTECLGNMLFANYHATEWDKLKDRINEKSDDQA